MLFKRDGKTLAAFTQCYICRGWSWLASKSHGGVNLCLPCYVDVLEVRQGRGLMATEHSGGLDGDGWEPRAETGKSPSPFDQLDLFGD